MHKKRNLLVLASIIVVIIAAIVLYVHHQNNSKNTADQKATYQQLLNSTQSLVSSHNYTLAENMWLKYLKTNPNKQYTRNAYVQLATTYTNASKYDQAVSYYQKARTLDGTDKLDVVLGLAYAYEAKGDKSQAISYFQKAIDLTNKTDDPLKQADIQGYKYEIKQLGGQS